MNMKIKLNWKLIAGLAGLNLAFASLAASDDELNQLKQQIQELDQKVRILEREREIDQDSASTAAKAAPRIIIGGSGFNFSSGDSNFTAQIHGLVQFDSRTFFQDGGINGNDGFLLRRARPILTGTLFHDFD